MGKVGCWTKAIKDKKAYMNFLVADQQVNIVEALAALVVKAFVFLACYRVLNKIFLGVFDERLDVVEGVGVSEGPPLEQTLALLFSGEVGVDHCNDTLGVVDLFELLNVVGVYKV